MIFMCKPLSLNHAKVMGRDGKTHNSKQYNTFRQNIWPLLAAQRDIFRAIAKDFIHGEHFINMVYTFGIPSHIFFTKSGKISKKSGDVDNLVKPVNDLIFTAIESFNKEIDDGLVLMLGSKKIPSEQYFIAVKIILDSYQNIQ